MSSPEFYRSISFFPVVDGGSCTRCAACVDACGLAVLSCKPGEGVVARRGVCRNCRKCVEACPRAAVKISAELKGSELGRIN